MVALRGRAHLHLSSHKRTYDVALTLHLPQLTSRCEGDPDSLAACMTGWMMYSVERVYEAPIVASAECSVDSSTMSVLTFNNFKTSNTYQAYYKVISLLDGQPVADGEFVFEAHWRPTYLNVTIEGVRDLCSSGCQVVISNKIKDSTSANFVC